MLRVAVARPRGHRRAPTPTIEQRANTGTVRFRPPAACPARAEGWVHRRPIRPGRGGAAVVLRAGESPGTWGRAAAVSRREGGCNAERRTAEQWCSRPVSIVGQGVWGCRPSFTVGQSFHHGRRFDDLFNLVCSTRRRCSWRSNGSRANKGARTPGVDGLTVVNVERELGLPGYLEDLQRVLKTGEFRPLPVRERRSPSPGEAGRCASSASRPSPTGWSRQPSSWCWSRSRPTSCRSPTVSGPCGARTTRSLRSTAMAPAAIAGCWDADIEACFDSIDHTALMDRVRASQGQARAAAGQGVSQGWRPH